MVFFFHMGWYIFNCSSWNVTLIWVLASEYADKIVSVCTDYMLSMEHYLNGPPS